jgi:hypothetical protein
VVVDTATGYSPADFARLRAIRAAVDPEGRFVANHRVDAGRYLAEEVPPQR